MKVKVSNYIPFKGFSDLRKFILSIKMFKKLWKIQAALSHMEKNKKFYKNQHPTQWQKAKKLSAEYQLIINSSMRFDSHKEDSEK